VPKNAKILIGALLAVLFVGALMVFLPDDEAGTTEIVWITEKTTRSPGVFPDALRSRIDELSADGGVRLVVHAVGGRGNHVTTTDLDLVQDGDKVTDPDRRRAAVDSKLAEVTAQLASVPVGDKGFSLYAALRTAADEAARIGGPVEVWLSTTVLSGSTDPLSIPMLTEAEVDPSQAVDELMKGPLRDLDLGGVRLEVVLLTPVRRESTTPRSCRTRQSWSTRTSRGRLSARSSVPTGTIPADIESAWSDIAPITGKQRAPA
jgi:hypothetical protein